MNPVTCCICNGFGVLYILPYSDGYRRTPRMKIECEECGGLGKFAAPVSQEMPNGTVPLSCRVTEPVADEVDRAAQDKGLSRNAFLCAFLERWAKRRGVKLTSPEES